MLSLDEVTESFIEAKDPYLAISPGVPSVIRPPRVKMVLGVTLGTAAVIRRRRKGHSYRDIAVDFAAKPVSGRLTKPILGPVRTRMTRAYIWASRHSGPGLVIGPKPDAKGDPTRTWISEPGKYEMVIIYHDADKAGPHVDVHIDKLSLIYSLRNKPNITSKLKFSASGELTGASKEILVEHVRSEIANGSRVPQNLDHPSDQAVYSWLDTKQGPHGYGAGSTRQIVSQSKVEVYKAYEDGPIEFFAPVIDPNHALYLYQIYPGTEQSAPIIIWGKKSSQPPVLEDRLHLRMVDPADLDKWKDKLDMSTSTAKYDGSSTYLHITQKSTTAWSPRISKRTGQRIEYTPKINGLASLTHGESVIAMGELMFYRTTLTGRKKWLDHGTSAGILNGHNFLPDGIKPMVVIYRVDRVGRSKTINLPFWEQRKLAEEIVAKKPDMLMVPELLSPKAAKRKGFEGVVIARPGEGVTTAIKTKWWDDPLDWRIDKVDLHYSEKGNVAGVVWMTDLESGKRFKMGPGQIGDRATCEAMMLDPKLYEGSVYKVRSRVGHTGRAAKVHEEHMIVDGQHMDKGTSPF